MGNAAFAGRLGREALDRAQAGPDEGAVDGRSLQDNATEAAEEVPAATEERGGPGSNLRSSVEGAGRASHYVVALMFRGCFRGVSDLRGAFVA